MIHGRQVCSVCCGTIARVPTPWMVVVADGLVCHLTRKNSCYVGTFKRQNGGLQCNEATSRFATLHFMWVDLPKLTLSETKRSPPVPCHASIWATILTRRPTTHHGCTSQVFVTADFLLAPMRQDRRLLAYLDDGWAGSGTQAAFGEVMLFLKLLTMAVASPLCAHLAAEYVHTNLRGTVQDVRRNIGCFVSCMCLGLGFECSGSKL